MSNTKNKREAQLNGISLLRKKSRGPYFLNWSTLWDVDNLAHEFGHLFGLDDEYKNRLGGGSTDDCDSRSLMCQSWTGSQRDYHYYLILRRAFCSL